MRDDAVAPVCLLRLSTGYQVQVDLEKPATRGWRGHLARAILGERVLREAGKPMDRSEQGLHFEAIPEEILYLLKTTPSAVKDALLYQLIYEDIARLGKSLDVKLGRPSLK